MIRWEDDEPRDRASPMRRRKARKEVTKALLSLASTAQAYAHENPPKKKIVDDLATIRFVTMDTECLPQRNSGGSKGMEER